MVTPDSPSYAGHRFPAEIIGHAVWLYFPFPLSLRMVEEMLAARGIVVSHETVRQWAMKFGQAFANQIRRRLPHRGDRHLDEVVLEIAGKKHWLWRAVDQTGTVLDVLVQSRRDKGAAKRLLCKLLKRQCRTPRVVITDKLTAMGRRRSRSCRALSTGSTRVSTTGRRTRTSRRDGENDKGSGSNQPARRNASSPPMTRSTTSFISAATTSLPASIEPQGGMRLRREPTSAGLLPQLDLHATWPSVGPETTT